MAHPATTQATELREIEDHLHARRTELIREEVPAVLDPLARLGAELHGVRTIVAHEGRVVYSLPPRHGLLGSTLGRSDHVPHGIEPSEIRQVSTLPRPDAWSLVALHQLPGRDRAEARTVEKFRVAVCEATTALLGAVERKLQLEDREAVFWHQYLHGISTIDIEASMLERVTADEPTDDLVATYRRRLVTSLRHQITCEKFNALNILSGLMPGFIPGTEREPTRPTNPMGIVLQMLPRYAHQASIRSITLDVEEDGSAGETDFPQVRLRETAFRRIVHNLLSNAIKYSYHGIEDIEGNVKYRSIKVIPKVRHDTTDTTCSIAFENYGIGIEPDELGKVRLPRYRGRQAENEVRVGTGLGLTEVVGLTSEIGGTVSIQSHLLHGATYKTTVKLILPVHEPRKRRESHR